MLSKITSVIICDDVRREMSGKDILIGVYSGTINVPAYPANFPAAFWFEIEPTQLGSLPIEIKIEPPSGNPPFQVSVSLDVHEIDTSVFVMGGVPITVERDGEIIVSAKIGSEPWSVVKRKKVRRQAFPSQVKPQ